MKTCPYEEAAHRSVNNVFIGDLSRAWVLVYDDGRIHCGGAGPLFYNDLSRAKKRASSGSNGRMLRPVQVSMQLCVGDNYAPYSAPEITDSLENKGTSPD